MNEVITKKGNRRISFFDQLRKYFGIYINKKFLAYKVVFTESCIYNSKVIEGINKLFGLTFGLLNVHKSSARFGWQPSKNNKIELYAYIYENSVLNQFFLCECDLNKEYKLKLKVTDQDYVFTCNNLSYTAKHSEISNLSYQNFMYFGGINPAPQDVRIKVEKI